MCAAANKGIFDSWLNSNNSYNIASRATRSNSVYVSVLKIPKVHANSMSKSLRFATIMATNRNSAHQSQNKDNFPTFSLGLEFLNEAEKEKNT